MGVVHLVGGCKAEAATPKPLAYAAAGGITADTPRKNFPILARPQYQSSAGSCAPHGATFVLESDVAERTGADVELCRLDVYRGARLLENNGAERVDGGSYPSLLHRWIRDFGTLSEIHAPYDPSLVTTWKPDPALDAERALLNGDLQPIPVAVGPIVAELAAGRCVAFWHQVYGNMTDIPKDGIEREPQGRSLGGHYRAFIGYDMDQEVTGYGPGVLYAHNWWRSWGIAHPWAANHPDFEAHRDSVSIIPFSLLGAPGLFDGAARLARGLDVED